MTTTHLHHRYTLLDPIGHGSMGTVFRAYDRLTNQPIALKRLTVQSGSDLGPQEDTHSKLRLILANEFQNLASLRHPYIISVLDYGFDTQKQPFFTMTYLENAQTLLQAAEGIHVKEKIELLVQVLEALSYLHQRGVLHRDLKPANILVQDGHPYLLDFGLAVAKEKAAGRAGSPAYMAPEILFNAGATQSSDLYSFGVIAYQLFAGKLPFSVSAVKDILRNPPDMSPFVEISQIGVVIEKLLEKDPGNRYQNPREVIHALSKAIGKPAPPEPLAFQESFLQAARFIGRREEVDTLTEALRHALHRRGSAWLIGGESGVGKSRLLEEIRTRALVGGAHVYRGQAVEGGGMPYQLWREAARELTLSVKLTPLEAGVLQEIVPDLASLLNMEIPDPPELDARFRHQRLVYIFTHVVRKAARTHPIVFVLEDLHWSKESLDFLPPLLRICPELPFLILASFRNEERPDLPEHLPGIQTHLLHRLNETEMTELTVSMIGKEVSQPQVLKFLQKETEGNTYFLVETIRALAEEAGGVEAIGVATLPAAVFAGGVQMILQRRLRRVSEAYLPVLKFAAIAGRHIDPKLIQAYVPHMTLDVWLAHCTGFAILDVYEGGWRFAHDKLRENLISQLSESERKTLHEQVARHLEQIYAGELTPYYGILADHYHHAEKTEREYQFVALAGEQAIAQYANTDAIRYLTREWELTPETDITTRFNILMKQFNVHDLVGQRENQGAVLNQLEALSEKLPPEKNVEILLQKSLFQLHQREYELAYSLADRAYDLATQLPEPTNKKWSIQARVGWGRIAFTLGDLPILPKAVTYLEEAISLAHALGDDETLGRAMGLLGQVFWRLKKHSEAKAYLEQALILHRQVGARRSETSALNGLGNIMTELNNAREAFSYYKQALTVEREIGYRFGESLELLNLSYIGMETAKYREALEYAQQALEVHQELGNEEILAFSFFRLATLYERLGVQTRAKQHLEEGMVFAEKLNEYEPSGLLLRAQLLVREDLSGAIHLAEQAETKAKERDPYFLPVVTIEAANFHLRAKQYAQALQWFEKASGLEHLSPHHIAEINAGLAAVAFAQGEPEKAIAHIEEVLHHTQTNSELFNFQYPEFTFLTCYQILVYQGDPRADGVLTQAHVWIEDAISNLPHDFDINLFWNARPERKVLHTLYQNKVLLG